MLTINVSILHIASTDFCIYCNIMLNMRISLVRSELDHVHSSIVYGPQENHTSKLWMKDICLSNGTVYIPPIKNMNCQK